MIWVCPQLWPEYFWLKQLYTESAEIIGIKYRFYKPRVINNRCCDLKQTHLCPKFFCDENRTVWNYLRKWTANVSASFLGVQTFPCDFSSPFESIKPRDLVLVFFSQRARKAEHFVVLFVYCDCCLKRRHYINLLKLESWQKLKLKWILRMF